MMNGLKKSDEAVRPVRAANKGARASAESPEERASTKGNPDCQSTRRTQCRVSVPQAAARIRKAAERNPKERLTALFHHITPDALGAAYFALKKDAAAGVDGVTWDMYGEGLDERLLDLHRRLHRGGAYRAPPVRRVEIPKPDGGTRPLGIAALEGRVCNGWLNYFAVPGSGRFIRAFLRRLQRRWMRALRRRSQRARFSWKRLERMTEILWPRASIRHPWPDQRFAVKHPR